MRKLSDCRVLLIDDAKANLDILVERLKPDHKLSIGKAIAAQAPISIVPAAATQLMICVSVFGANP